MGAGLDGNACKTTTWLIPAYSGLFRLIFGHSRPSGIRGLQRLAHGTPAMNTGRLTESVVEDAALAWLEGA